MDGWGKQRAFFRNARSKYRSALRQNYERIEMSDLRVNDVFSYSPNGSLYRVTKKLINGDWMVYNIPTKKTFRLSRNRIQSAEIIHFY